LLGASRKTATEQREDDTNALFEKQQKLGFPLALADSDLVSGVPRQTPFQVKLDQISRDRALATAIVGSRKAEPIGNRLPPGRRSTTRV
jgi:hypothetical protein